MDQATTLRNLMHERGGDPFAGLSPLLRTQFVVPYRWKDSAYRMLLDLADRVYARSTGEGILIVDAFERTRRLDKVETGIHVVGAEKLASRLDEELTQVLGIRQIWSMHPYLEIERDLRWLSANAPQYVLLHGTTDEALVDAYRQLRTLSSRCGVKKVDSFVIGECDLRDAVRVHSKLEEMGNRFLDLDLGFLGNLKLNPLEYLLHYKTGDARARFDVIAQKWMSQSGNARDLGEVRQ